MNLHPIRLLPALLILLLCLPSQADATVMRYADLDRLIETSHIIVEATVTEISTGSDDKGTLWTDIHLDIHETFLGDPAEELIVAQWGGSTNTRTARIPGDAQFYLEQEVILFLRRDQATQKLTLTALSQGFFEIHQTQSDTPTARRDLSDISFLSHGPGSTITDHREPAHDLHSFKEILRDLVSSHQETP